MRWKNEKEVDMVMLSGLARALISKTHMLRYGVQYSDFVRTHDHNGWVPLTYKEFVAYVKAEIRPPPFPLPPGMWAHLDRQPLYPRTPEAYSKLIDDLYAYADALKKDNPRP